MKLSIRLPAIRKPRRPAQQLAPDLRIKDRRLYDVPGLGKTGAAHRARQMLADRPRSARQRAAWAADMQPGPRPAQEFRQQRWATRFFRRAPHRSHDVGRSVRARRERGRLHRSLRALKIIGERARMLEIWASVNPAAFSTRPFLATNR